MRNELLTAYSLHQRPFQDKRTIYYLLTKEHGIVHGVAKKGIPLFSPLSLFATGKKSLKTFQQVTITDNVPTLIGAHQYAALYINEITYHLLPLEDNVQGLYNDYHQVICKLQQDLSKDELRLALRVYENALFEELGLAIDLVMDGDQHAIDAEKYYSFITGVGWVPMDNGATKDSSATNRHPKNQTLEKSNIDSVTSYDHLTIHQKNFKSSLHNKIITTGSQIIKMRTGFNLQTVQYWEPIHKQLIDFLFEYKPLQSRILWQQYHRYQ